MTVLGYRQLSLGLLLQRGRLSRADIEDHSLRVHDRHCRMMGCHHNVATGLTCATGRRNAVAVLC